ncbi:MAG: glycosyl transferase [Alphaproteobacteria bacterium]|nr:glycosyl transferase [Alphaproteobacteria bacterium]
MRNAIINRKTEVPRPREWLGIIVLFLVAGIVGHEPWRGDETYGFGIIYHFYTTGTWLVPTNAGVPFMEKPPLYYWTAVWFCRLLGGWLPLHDAARLSSVMYMLITTRFMWKLSRLLFASLTHGEALAWMAVALLLGSLGLIRYAHELSTDVALLTGATVTLYGMAILLCAPERWRSGGAWTGVGLGAALLAKGFLVPALFGISALLLWAVVPALHTRRTAKAAGVAAIALLPFLLWPLALYLRAPELFMQWFWENNVGRFLGFSVSYLGARNEPLYFFRIIPWFAFPAFPLACITVVKRWRTARYEGAYALPLAVAAVGTALLLISASGRSHYLLPLLPAFALLGAQSLPLLPRAFLIGWNWAVRVLCSAIGAAVWLLWWNLMHPAAEHPLAWLAHLTGKWLPLAYMPPGSQRWSCLLAGAIAAGWLASFRLKTTSALNTAYIWLAGATLAWGSAYTLLLPWLDATKGYRLVFTDMMQAANASADAKGCIAAYNLDESVAPMFQYFLGRLAPEQDFSGHACPLIFAKTYRDTPEVFDPRWRLIWKGSRLLDEKNEQLRLYERVRE